MKSSLIALGSNFSNRNNDISCTHTREHATLRENFEKMCNLMRLGEYFDQILY